jgi:hypothetical protein
VGRGSRVWLGVPSSRVISHQRTLRARAERRQQHELARELRRQRRRANQLSIVNSFSKRWISGAPVPELAREYGIGPKTFLCRISRYRKQFPEKFPFRRAELTQEGKRARKKYGAD